MRRRPLRIADEAEFGRRFSLGPRLAMNRDMARRQSRGRRGRVPSSPGAAWLQPALASGDTRPSSLPGAAVVRSESTARAAARSGVHADHPEQAGHRVSGGHPGERSRCR